MGTINGLSVAIRSPWGGGGGEEGNRIKNVSLHARARNHFQLSLSRTAGLARLPSTRVFPRFAPPHDDAAIRRAAIRLSTDFCDHPGRGGGGTLSDYCVSSVSSRVAPALIKYTRRLSGSGARERRYRDYVTFYDELALLLASSVPPYLRRVILEESTPLRARAAATCTNEQSVRTRTFRSSSQVQSFVEGSRSNLISVGRET